MEAVADHTKTSRAACLELKNTQPFTSLSYSTTLHKPNPDTDLSGRKLVTPALQNVHTNFCLSVRSMYRADKQTGKTHKVNYDNHIAKHSHYYDKTNIQWYTTHCLMSCTCDPQVQDLTQTSWWVEFVVRHMCHS